MESEALDAFFTYIAGFATLPVYWPNVAVPGTPANEHYRVSVFPVSPDTIDTCGGSRYTWIVQVSVYVRDGVGSIKPAQFVDLLRTALPDSYRLTSDNHIFQTANPCTVIPPLRVDGWNITPVQCRFFTIN